MIAFNFIYYRPDTLQEAVRVFSQLQAQNKNAVYYAGGSEIITLSRSDSIRPDAVIDIKHIPACREMNLDAEALHIGAACTLTQISESNLFPLLRLSGGRIADHTNQCRITLGGNLCGTILYREASLPLLLSDAQITLFGPEGKRTVAFQSVFDGRMRAKPGELIVQVHVPKWALSARYAHIKKTANEKIDYPLVSVAAIWKDGSLRIGFSGICSYPFRCAQMEALFNDRTRSCEERAICSVKYLPEPVCDDRQGSGAYRLFVFQNTVRKLLEDWEHGSI